MYLPLGLTVISMRVATPWVIWTGDEEEVGTDGGGSPKSPTKKPTVINNARMIAEPAFCLGLNLLVPSPSCSSQFLQFGSNLRLTSTLDRQISLDRLLSDEPPGWCCEYSEGNEDSHCEKHSL